MKKFEELEKGSVVVISGRGTDKIGVVDRTTATQIVVDGSKYRKSDGGSVGTDVWSNTNIKVPTDDELVSLREKEYKFALINMLHNYKGYAKLDTSKLEELCQVIGLNLPKQPQ
jgi:hypothetical protein